MFVVDNFEFLIFHYYGTIGNYQLQTLNIEFYIQIMVFVSQFKTLCYQLYFWIVKFR